jgi:hypothetical protein
MFNDIFEIGLGIFLITISVCVLVMTVLVSLDLMGVLSV